MASIPQTTHQWILPSTSSDISTLTLSKVPLPALGHNDILVQFHALALNYCDITLARGHYSQPWSPGHTQGTDSNLGAHADGVFRTYGVFPAHALVNALVSLSFREVCTLPCAALTAWSCLFSASDQHVCPGDTVLVQGTGGVSLFALQFARAAGATVVATTSSSSKAELLKLLGAAHIINYHEEATWGIKAKELSPGGHGADIVIDVGGASTVSQSLAAMKAGNAQICLVGHLSGGDAAGLPTVWDVRQALCKVRSVMVGSQNMFEDMVRAVDGWGIRPVIDGKTWWFEEMRAAYEYLADRKHVGKVVVDIE